MCLNSKKKKGKMPVSTSWVDWRSWLSLAPSCFVKAPLDSGEAGRTQSSNSNK